MKTWSLVTRYFGYLERKGRPFNIIVGVFATLFLGVSDYFIGLEYSLAFFYLLPVFFVSLLAGRNAGIAISLLSALCWMISNNNMGLTFPHIWNSATTLGFLLVSSLMLSKMRAMYEQERAVARTDHLTGAVNSRAFAEIAELEILRLSRTKRPFTLAYIDVDNFKAVNDYHGHSTGDLLLQTVIATLTGNLRRTDVIARLGGDEFCLLLPDTDSNSARVVVQKLFEDLTRTITDYNWQVTFSVGALTCYTPPDNSDHMISLADKLMYEVKKNGKNNIRYDIYAELDPNLPNNLFAL